MVDCRAASFSKEMVLICGACVCLPACVWVCAFRRKVNWVAAVVPETETTGFVIAVTFLPAPLHTLGNGVRVCAVWADVQSRRCCVLTSLYKVYFVFTCWESQIGKVWGFCSVSTRSFAELKHSVVLYRPTDGQEDTEPQGQTDKKKEGTLSFHTLTS